MHLSMNSGYVSSHLGIYTYINHVCPDGKVGPFIPILVDSLSIEQSKIQGIACSKSGFQIRTLSSRTAEGRLARLHNSGYLHTDNSLVIQLHLLRSDRCP